MQDIALYHMEKLNRRNKVVEKTETLAEQIKRMDDWHKLTPTEKLKHMPYSDWLVKLKEHLVLGRQSIVPGRCFDWMTMKRKTQLQEFHANGTSFTEIAAWAKEMSLVYMNL